MYYSKDFNSLSVLSLYEGDLLGVVDKLLFDKKLKKLCEIELVGVDGARLSLPIKNIYHIGKNAITVKNNQAVTMKAETGLSVAPIDSKAFSITGEFLGVINEIVFNEKFLCEKISLENGELLNVKDIATCGRNAVIFYNANKRVNLNTFNPPSVPEQFKGQEVKTETMPIKEEEKQQKQSHPVQNINFLVGRICTKDIFNFNNELLIKAHSVVNKKNLKEINRFGKLRELMLYLK